jgi:hypothetical protein
MRWGPPVLVCAFVVLAAGPAAAVPQADERTSVKIFAPRRGSEVCSRVFPLARVVRGPRILRATMAALVAGPTRAERRRGYRGFFSAKTSGTVLRAFTRGSVAFVDFANFSTLIPNASSSCGSASLLAQLNRTVRQFPGIKRAVYSFNGSRKAFYEWLQRPVPAAG